MPTLEPTKQCSQESLGSLVLADRLLHLLEWMLMVWFGLLFWGSLTLKIFIEDP